MEKKLFNELSQFCFTYMENEDIWFVGQKYPLIFQANIGDCKIKKVIRIEGEKLAQPKRYWKLVKVQNKIVLLPLKHDKIVIFNIDNQEFSFVYLDKPVLDIMSYVIQNRMLYLIFGLEIICLDVKDEKIEEYISIPYKVDISSAVSLLVEGHILIPLIYEDQLLDFNIADKHFSRLDLNCKANGFVAGVVDGQDVWLAGCNGNIVKWNWGSGQCISYNKLPEQFGSFDYDMNGKFLPWKTGWHETGWQGCCFKYWYDSFMIDDKVWFIPFLSDSLIYIDKRTNELKSYTFMDEGETELTMRNHRTIKFLFIGIEKNRYIKLYSVKRDLIYSIDVKTLNYVEETFNTDQIDTGQIEKEYWDTLYNMACEGGIYESNNISISELLTLAGRERPDIDAAMLNGRVGTHIYNSCIDMLQQRCK